MDRITVPHILSRKNSRQKIIALTAYDFTFARLLDRAGVEVLLVGDSLASVIQGESNTLSATLDEMIYHCRCVTRGVEHALVVGDLPFMSYQVSPEQAVTSAGRLIKEGRVAAVKLEGGIEMAEAVRRITSVDIPVMGHVGLTPQSFHRMGGHRVQGRSQSSEAAQKRGSWQRVLADAEALEEAGAFAVVIEGVPAELAAEITSTLTIPTIGIGAGAECDGQILVSYDLLGLEDRSKPRFVKQYVDLAAQVSNAVESFAAEVRNGTFPALEHTWQKEAPKLVNQPRVVRGSR